jgi:hypothetical protein
MKGNKLLSCITDEIYAHLLNFDSTVISVRLSEDSMRAFLEYALPTIRFNDSSLKFNYGLQYYTNVIITITMDKSLKSDYYINYY